ncbi:1-acyl-sn-glycerol-3-phosphate acyltransferase delta isoform X1 [Moschus berezovskii]|uniref:1-acyl-sn-glycerol-3-phosphate acyltransferase delta isoform X1 n=1 Tax=Moschus berezovskii TaxID=68408 RepID=UPI002444E46A|nr:1-acyl-sn-glycerol-3-phosphate acyltransferase delta isoform X1 [Moschus berezovskii]
MDLAALLKSHFLCHLIFCYVFIASGLIINTVQLFTLLLWPVNKQLFRKINCRLSYCISSQLVMLLEWWSGTECVIYTDPQAYPKYGKENAIVVLNHKFEIDFLCGWSLAERFGVLGGSKVLAKKELAYVPIIGWMWYFTEMVFCTRKWEQDRKTVSESLLHLRDYPEKYFFLIHCEGTRFTEKKHQISMQVAQAKGLPSLKHHLLPRTKGFAVTVRSLRNVVSAVYDCTLNFRNNENPTLLGVLNGKKYHADLYVRRIPLEEVPEEEDKCAAWLHKLYQEKDAFQEEYSRTGTFPETPVVPPRRPWTLINWLFWASLLLYPFFRFVVNMVSSGSSLTLASFVLVFFVEQVWTFSGEVRVGASPRLAAAWGWRSAQSFGSSLRALTQASFQGTAVYARPMLPWILLLFDGGGGRFPLHRPGMALLAVCPGEAVVSRSRPKRRIPPCAAAAAGRQRPLEEAGAPRR